MTAAAPPPRYRGLLGLFERTSLRAKLMAVLFLLATVAVVATGVVASAVLRVDLLDRVDATLERYSVLAQPYLTVPGVTPSSPTGAVPGLPAPYTLVVRDAAGDVIRREDAPPERAELLPRLTRITLAQAEADGGRPFTVPDEGGRGPDWRVRVIVLDGRSTLTLAVGLDEVDATVGQLERALFAVGLAVLVVVTGLAYFIVRSGLGPLKQVEATAEAIAAGDLSRRVSDRYGRLTEVGQLAVALNGMLAQLESTIGDREASERAAVASEERMRRFIGDAGHELRTPLTSIRGFAELYRQGAANAPGALPDLMRRIEEEAARMGILVEDLLLLTRLEQARPLRRDPVDLVGVAADAVTAARATHPSRPFELRAPDWTSEDSTVVIGDAARLRQVADNLVRNACVHTPAGTPVTVRVGTITEDARRWAVLEVADCGPGVSVEEAGKVFERFYRTDRSRARATGGSGLGLSIVAALVAAHDGRVTVSSPPEGGAVFRVLLPQDTTPRVRPPRVRSGVADDPE
jgi:two-component system OmpR family sensor kinase